MIRLKIEHIAIYTNDLECLRRFYQTYFDGTVGQPYENPNTGLRTYFLTFADGARLELMTRPVLEQGARADWTAGWAHLAFQAGGREAVDALTQRLRADGYVVASEPRVTGDGYYESCVRDPDGNMIEITA